MIVTPNSKNKVVFAVTSKGNDFYSTMTRVAVASLRLSNPDLFIIVACDRETDNNMKLSNDLLIEEVDCWLEVDTPNGSDGFRNRFVKTNLRKMIEGPFLFLDSDVLVRKNLNEIFKIDADIAAARNHSREIFSEQIWEADEAALKALGWEIGSKVYINGGVIFFNDTPKARHFGEEWHKNWQYSYDILKRYRDQPSLNYAIQLTKPKFFLLSDRYNSQFKSNPKSAKNSFLWHYYTSENEIFFTKFEIYINDILNGGKMNNEDIKNIINAPHPWRRNNFFDDVASRSLMKNNMYKGWGAAWLKREFKQYLMRRYLSIY